MKLLVGPEAEPGSVAEAGGGGAAVAGAVSDAGSLLHKNSPPATSRINAVTARIRVRFLFKLLLPEPVFGKLAYFRSPNE